MLLIVMLVLTVNLPRAGMPETAENVCIDYNISFADHD